MFINASYVKIIESSECSASAHIALPFSLSKRIASAWFRGTWWPYINTGLWRLDLVSPFCSACREIYPGKLVASYGRVVSSWSGGNAVFLGKALAPGKSVCSSGVGCVGTMGETCMGIALSSSLLISAIRSCVDGSRRALTSFLRLTASRCEFLRKWRLEWWSHVSDIMTLKGTTMGINHHQINLKILVGVVGRRF